MCLIEVRANFLCDGCGRPFNIRIEPPYVPPEGWSVFDVAEDAVRGSIDYVGPKNEDGTRGSSSVQDGRHLCGLCTFTADRD
jgi:hypothetical protein